MSKIKLAFKFAFFFLGTFLHELAHYIAALLLGKAEGFSVVPRIEGSSFIFGSVKSRAKYKVLSSFIAFAPILWWAVLFLILLHFHIIRTNNNIPEIHFTLLIKRLNSFSFKHVFYIWLFIQMLWAGKLSIQDIKNFFSGFFSVSGFILVSAVAGIVYLIKHYL